MPSSTYETHQNISKSHGPVGVRCFQTNKSSIYISLVSRACNSGASSRSRRRPHRVGLPCKRGPCRPRHRGPRRCNWPRASKRSRASGRPGDRRRWPCRWGRPRAPSASTAARGRTASACQAFWALGGHRSCGGAGGHNFSQAPRGEVNGRAGGSAEVSGCVCEGKWGPHWSGP